MPSVFESLPVELIADILKELDLSSLVVAAYLSHRLHSVASDNALNPWREPIMRTLRHSDGEYDSSLKHLSVRTIVPRQNFVEVLSIAKAPYLIFEATLPNLREREWEQCFRRRFLPGWAKVKKEGCWKEAFMKMLNRIWHRNNSSCTADEAWTKYIVLNRNGTANQLESASRNYTPMQIYDQLKMQSNLLHLATRIRVLVEFADVRILAIGVLNDGSVAPMFINRTARPLLHPPGVEIPSSAIPDTDLEATVSLDVRSSSPQSIGDINQVYRRLAYPLPALCHENYPFYTPSGEDRRWFDTENSEEKDQQWIGSMMLTAQLIGPHTKESDIEEPPVDFDLVLGPQRNQYASLTFEDLNAVAPWLEVAQWIDGPGLGH